VGRCENCNGTGVLSRCRRCGVMYCYINKYSDCDSPGCDGERSDLVPCPDCQGKPNLSPGKYRKRPVVIEAYQHLTGFATTISEWAGSAVEFDADRGVFCVRTLEGVVTAEMGDWIIRGVNGEFYPCKPDIFAATYEAA